MHTEPKYEIPPVPEKSRARAFSGGSGNGAALGRHPSERYGAGADRYSWNTGAGSERNGFSNGYSNHGNGTGRSASPVSPVSAGGAYTHVSRSPTIGGPEYRTLSPGRTPSFTTD